MNYNVYDAAQSRLEKVFDTFEQIVVSFSGGKDSGVMLNMALEYASRIGALDRLAVYHLDYEAQYQMTTEYVERTFEALPDSVAKYWVCLPVHVPCATSMMQNYWSPWEESKRDLWVREMPNGCIHSGNAKFDFDLGCSDYEFNLKFAHWMSRTKRTCFLIGIRTQESLNRFRAVNKESDRNFNGWRWSTIVSETCVNVYPIFDWKTEDVWIANGRFGYDYNRLYDLFHKAGVPIHKMRVASPFIEQGIGSLKLYKAIDPDNWGRMIGRVNGVNFAGLYGGTTAMGWKSIKLPAGHTWESYMYFLLDTLPEDVRRNYLEKLAVSKQFWEQRGGVLSEDVISSLSDAGVEVEVGAESSYNTTKRPVRLQYQDDVDIPAFREIPTYKRMCICIMKNDHTCKYMGFSQTKAEIERRKNAIKKYSKIL